MPAIKWPRPRVYKSVAEIVKAHGSDDFYTRYMEPSSILYGIRMPNGNYRWYEYDRNVRGFVMRATTRWAGPARIFPANQASQAFGDVAVAFPRRPGESMRDWIRRLNVQRGSTDSDPFSGLGAMGDFPWAFVGGIALVAGIMWVTRPIKA